MLYGGGVGLESVESYGALCREMGWHLQFLLDARTPPPLAATLGGLPVPIVIDHMGHFPSSAGIGDPGFRTLLGLVRDGAWVKLQGVRTPSPGRPITTRSPSRSSCRTSLRTGACGVRRAERRELGTHAEDR